MLSAELSPRSLGVCQVRGPPDTHGPHGPHPLVSQPQWPLPPLQAPGPVLGPVGLRPARAGARQSPSHTPQTGWPIHPGSGLQLPPEAGVAGVGEADRVVGTEAPSKWACTPPGAPAAAPGWASRPLLAPGCPQSLGIPTRPSRLSGCEMPDRGGPTSRREAAAPGEGWAQGPEPDEKAPCGPNPAGRGGIPRFPLGPHKK